MEIKKRKISQLVYIAVELKLKPIKMHPKTWSQIRQKLHKEYPPSYFFRSKMKERLGFSIREHNAWILNKDYDKEYRDYQDARDSANPVDILLSIPPERGYTRREVHLDFYSENKRTMFLLKYSEELATDDQKY